MADKKKPVVASDGKDRRANGKAYKGGLAPEKRKPKAQVKTEARQRRDEEIRLQRERRREVNIQRRIAEKEARAQIELRKRAEEAQAATTAEALTKLTGVERAPREVQVTKGRRTGKRAAQKEVPGVVFSSADFHAAQNEEWDREEKK